MRTNRPVQGLLPAASEMRMMWHLLLRALILLICGQERMCDICSAWLRCVTVTGRAAATQCDLHLLLQKAPKDLRVDLSDIVDRIRSDHYKIRTK
jgi:hypothetical protein